MVVRAVLRGLPRLPHRLLRHLGHLLGLPRHLRVLRRRFVRRLLREALLDTALGRVAVRVVGVRPGAVRAVPAAVVVSLLRLLSLLYLLVPSGLLLLLLERLGVLRVSVLGYCWCRVRVLPVVVLAVVRSGLAVLRW